MKRIKHFVQTLSFACFLATAPLWAQSDFDFEFYDVPYTAEVGITYYTTLELTPLVSGIDIISYSWDVEYLGSGGSQVQGSINGSPFNPYLEASNELFSNADIVWGDEFAPQQMVKIVVTVYYEKGGQPKNTALTSHSIQLRGITQPVINGEASVQKCCLEPLTYTVTDYADGNGFSWAVPAGWSIVSGQNTPSITVLPDELSSGPVSCTVRRSEAVPQYFRTGTLSVNRFNPQVNRVAGSFPVYDLCPGETHTYQVLEICGAGYYEWTLPAGWQILSGQGTTTIQVFLSDQAQSGSIKINAYFPNSACDMVESFDVLVLTEPPVAPLIFNGEYPNYSNNYHCGQWWICPVAGGDIGPVSFDGLTTQFMVWTVTAPWHFGNNQQTMITGEFNFSPTIYGPASGAPDGQLCVQTGNCAGLSDAVCVSFSPQYGYWCENHYPEWCECCPPPCEGCPPYQLRPENPSSGPAELSEKGRSHSEKENQTCAPAVFPNPNAGNFSLVFPCVENGTTLQVFDNFGKLCFETSLSSPVTEHSLSALPAGQYWVKLRNETGVWQKTLLIQK